MTTGLLQRVLYVDDDPDIRELVQLALESTCDVTVRTADSGEGAITKMRELLPDLVLLDVMMPGMDGPATLRKMRSSEDLARVPVIFMTARSMPEDLDKLKKSGVVGVIAKPFDPMQLANQLMELWKQAA